MTLSDVFERVRVTRSASLAAHLSDLLRDRYGMTYPEQVQMAQVHGIGAGEWEESMQEADHLASQGWG